MHTEGGRLRGLAGGGGLQATPRGEVEGSGGGLQAQARGVSQHALRQNPPPSRRLLLRALCILLECIVVYIDFWNMLSFCYKSDTMLDFIDISGVRVLVLCRANKTYMLVNQSHSTN